VKLVIGNKNSSSSPLRLWLQVSHSGAPLEGVRLSKYQDENHTILAQSTEAVKAKVFETGDQTACGSMTTREYTSVQYLESYGRPKSKYSRLPNAEKHSLRSWYLGKPDVRTTNICL